MAQSRNALGQFSGGGGVPPTVTWTGPQRVFENWTPALAEALLVHVDRYAILLQGWIKSHYLSGDPLHRRTGVLSDSIGASRAEQSGNTVSSAVGTGVVGTRVKYAAVHELGLTVTVPQHERTISMVFGRSVDPHLISVREYTANYPRRPFISPSVSDTRAEFEAEMDAAVSDAAAKVNSGAA